jgi:hypothetical protein
MFAISIRLPSATEDKPTPEIFSGYCLLALSEYFFLGFRELVSEIKLVI